ncbi:hypothetical protein CVT25_013447, partial [Psilocybe cyanescens]
MSSESQSYTPSPPVPSSNVTPESCTRNPRIHRQSGIPSISRPLRGTPSPSPDIGAQYLRTDGQATPKSIMSTGTGKMSARKPKATGYQILSKTHHGDDVYDKPTPAAGNSLSYISSSRRQIASMPQDLPSNLQAQIDIDNDRLARGLASASPPIVDFTRFEDTYRGPRIGDLDGLVPHLNRSTAKAHAGIIKNGIRSSSTGEKPSLKTETPTPAMVGGRSAASLSVPGTAAFPASARKPDPRLIISSLRDVLGKSQRVEDYLDAFELLAAHQLDQLDFEERGALNAAFLERGKLDVKGRKGALVVLGEPIRKASMYSSTNVVLGGREHCLPIIAVNCIEELYRTGVFSIASTLPLRCPLIHGNPSSGIYQPHLFRSLPNRARLLELIGIFDSEVPLPGSTIRSRQSSGRTTVATPNAGFGINTSLHLESTPDICALLTTYLSSLPGPVLPPFMFRAVWDWCELDDDDDEHEESNRATPGPTATSAFGRRHGLPSTVPLARTYTSPAESTHILVAQLLLHLLPSPNFSLIIYLLAFFSQVALVREENGVGVEDLSRMFGGRIFGGGSIPSSTSQPAVEGRSAEEDVFNTTQTRREGEAMMSWFLRRWGLISEGLFDVVDDAEMGLFRRTLARKDSLGNDILSTWLSQDQYAGGGGGGEGRKAEGDDYDDVGRGALDAEEHQRCDDGKHHILTGPQKSPQPIPRIRLEAPQGHSTPKSKTATTWIKGKLRHNGANGAVQEIGIVDDYVVLSRTSTPTPTPKPNPLEDDTFDIARL